MAKVLALAAYLYQAGLAFGLLFTVARLLPPADYATYSIFIATTQFVAISFFEWIRFACSRFYPGSGPRSEADQRQTMIIEAALCAAGCLMAGAATILFGIPVPFALIGATVCILQGSTDLQLTMVRFYGRFHDFSWMLGLRATLLALATITGALIGETVLGATLGLLTGYLGFSAVIFVFERRHRFPRGRWRTSIARQHVTYGTAAAGATVLGLLAPLGFRFILISTFGPQAIAGALLAMDLLQRPFTLIISALHAVQYPDIVTAYDRKPRSDFARQLGQYYGLALTLSLLMAAGILVLIPAISALLLKPDLRDAFLVAAPLLVGVFLIRSLTQDLSTTPAHLRLGLSQLMVLALADVVGLNLPALVISHLPGVTIFSIVMGAVIGTVLAALPGVRVFMSMPFKLPVRPVGFAALAGFVAILVLSISPGGGLETSIVGVLAAGAIAMAALYTLYRTMKPARA